MAWLRKNTVFGGTELLRGPQSMPAFPSQDTTSGGTQGAAFLDFIGMNDALYPEPNFVNNADHGFDKNELVYACIMEKATSLPEAPFRIYGPDGMGQSRENHPLRQLLANPNPCTTEFELIELTSIFLDLAGVAFWEVVLDRLDKPAELWPLRPDRVRIFPKQNGRHEYGYAIGDGRIVPLGTNVLAFKYPNPMNPNLGQAPMRPANRAVSLDNEATDFVKALLQNHAVPGTVIETENAIDEAVTTRLTTKWVERFGKGNRGKPAFLQKGMKVHSLGLDLKALEFPDLRTISESRICMSFGVPPILVGAKVGLDRSTFANYGEARRSFWEETLLPLQRRIASVIMAQLLPMFEGPKPRRVIGKFDNSEVVALRESEANRWEKGTQALRSGGIMLNDFRRYVNLPTVPGGDVFLIPAGVTPVVDPSKMPEPPAPPPPPPNPAADDESSENQDESTPEDEAKALTQRPPVVVSRKQVPSTLRDAFAKDVAKVVHAQEAVVMAQVAKGGRPMLVSGRYTLVGGSEFKDDLWDSAKWNKAMTAAIEPHMRTVAHRAARKVDPGTETELMDGYIRAAAERTAKEWNEQTREGLTTALAVGGDDVAGSVAVVFAVAATARAATLATTASTEMNGFGKVDTAKRAGMPNKTWVVTSGNPRPEHAALDGETVPVNETFSDGSMWPGGPNCMCDVEFTSEGN